MTKANVLVTLASPTFALSCSGLFSCVKRRDLILTLCRTCLVPRRLSFDENVRAKEGGKETTGETSGRSCFQDGGKSNGGPICNF